MGCDESTQVFHLLFRWDWLTIKPLQAARPVDRKQLELAPVEIHTIFPSSNNHSSEVFIQMARLHADEQSVVSIYKLCEIACFVRCFSPGTKS